MMRAAWAVVASLAIALVVQLSVLNGLRLPGGGVPDLLLILVAALAMAEGPVTGMAVGFATGLCLDLAPPGSAVIGQYALVFCLAGWAAGRLGPVASHSGRQSAGLLATALLAVVVAAAEVLAAAVSLLVAPRAVTLSQIRVVLPSTIGYDLVLCPFVLYLVMAGGALLADRSAGAQRFRAVMAPGGGATSAGALAGTGTPRRAARRARLRPGAGVPGSASGLARQPRRPAPPVHLRLAAGRRRDGLIGGSGVGRGTGRSRGQRGSHPGALARSARTFRPRPGEPGGSAARSHSPATGSPGRRETAIRFAGHRGDGSLGHALAHSPARPGPAATRRRSAIRFASRRGDGPLGHALAHSPARPGPAATRRRSAIRFASRRGDGPLGHALAHSPARPGPAATRRKSAIRFASRRGDGSVGRTLAYAPAPPALAAPRRQPPIRFGERRASGTTGPWLRMGARRSAMTVAGNAAVPRLRFGSRPAPASRHSVKVPRFRRRTVALRPARLSSGVVPGGAATEATLRARRNRPVPRLRLSGGAPGMLGGTGRGPRVGRPPSRAGKQPRFSYGKRSPLSVLAGHRLGRHLGGSWLARWRVGSRSGVWLLGRRPGGLR
jgi:rod shape-determining protein MreD